MGEPIITIRGTIALFGHSSLLVGSSFFKVRVMGDGSEFQDHYFCSPEPETGFQIGDRVQVTGTLHFDVTPNYGWDGENEVYQGDDIKLLIHDAVVLKLEAGE